QSRGRCHPLGAGALSRALSRRRGGQRAAHAGPGGGAAMTALATLADVTLRYGAVTAVENVTLELRAGETLALVGHNGAGKTTLVKLVLGLIAPSGGTV